MTRPVLIIGGTGVVGSRVARTLRRLHPHVPIAIGARDLAKAEAVARELGAASAVALDTERADLGLPGAAAFSAAAVFLKDDSRRTLAYAQAAGIPYVAFSNWAFDIGPEVAHYIHRPQRSAVLMLGHLFGGTAVLSTLHFARAFRRIDAIELGVTLDSDDTGGPAAQGDLERIANGVPHPPLLRDGKWLWARGDDAVRVFRSTGGSERRGEAIPVLDVFSLAAATSARSVRVDLAVRDAASRPAGEPTSHEIAIEITGERDDGRTGLFRFAYADPRAHAGTSALGAALAIERLIGKAGGDPVAPGLYHPELLIDPAYAVERLREFGTRVEPA